MTRRWSAWATTLMLALSLVASGCEFDGAYDLPLPGGPVDKDKSYVVTADFHDVLNVVPKSPVMVDDVTVGEVTEVERVDWHARLEMRIRDDVELPANSIAVIRQTSLLGEKYVALEADPDEPAVKELLDDGSHIRIADTNRNPEVEEVLGALSLLLSNGGVGQLGTITAELNNVMTGRTGRLKTLLGTLDSVVGTIDDQKNDIIAALESMNDLASTLNSERKAITGALDVMGPAIAVLADQHDELMEMLRALDRLGVVGKRVIGASKDNIIASLRHLKPILTQLNKAGKSLPEGLSLMLSFPFPDEAQDIVKGDYGNTEIRLDINLENYLNAAGALPLRAQVVEPGSSGPTARKAAAPNLANCLDGPKLVSRDCIQFLTTTTLLKQLEQACSTQATTAVCEQLSKLPGIGGGGELAEAPAVPGLPELPGLPGLGEALAGAAPTGGTDLLGGLS